MGIERDLHDLLFCHDCVIVPQWGGFLTHYRGARLDEARRTIQPPGKDLSFNRHLVRNDGLLADHLAKREGIGFDVATARIDAEVSGWRDSLDRTGRLELQHIGIFFRDAEHNLQFDPDKRTNYLKDAFGLRPLAAVPVERTKTVPIVRTLDPQAEVKEDAPAGRTRVYWAAAAVGALLLGSAAFWMYGSGDRSGSQWSGFAGFGKHVAPSYVPPSQASFAPVLTVPRFDLPTELGVRTVPLTPDDSVTLIVDMGMRSISAPVDSTAVAMNPTPPPSEGGRYHVVGGCFAQPENADKLFNELVAKGYPARRLAQRGRLHPVVYGSYATKAEAVEAMASVRNNGGQAAWLLIR